MTPRTHVTQIRLNGTFQVTSPNRKDITPRGAKTRAVLALLATSHDMRRSRRWLESKLWSDRGTAQAHASLRQALCEIRRKFGAQKGILCSDRSEVWLDATRIEVVTGSEPFLDDLIVRDPCFRDWLRLERNRREAPSLAKRTSVAPKGMAIRCKGSGVDPLQTAEADALAHRIATAVREHVSGFCFARGHDTGSTGPTLEISCDAIEDGNKGVVSLSITAPETGEILFRKMVRTDKGGLAKIEPVTQATLAFLAVESVIGRLPVSSNCPAATLNAARLAEIGLRRMFFFDVEDLYVADRNFAAAYIEDPNPVYLAWRGMARVIQAAEAPPRNLPEIAEEAEGFVALSLQDGRDNAMVLAIAASVRLLLLGDRDGALNLAVPAYEKNPNNAFALQSLSATGLAFGATEPAFSLSRVGHQVGRLSRYRHWWDIYHCVVSAATGRLDEARLAASMAIESANALGRPILRLIDLYAQGGELDEARCIASRLVRDQLQGTKRLVA